MSFLPFLLRQRRVVGRAKDMRVHYSHAGESLIGGGRRPWSSFSRIRRRLRGIGLRDPFVHFHLLGLYVRVLDRACHVVCLDALALGALDLGAVFLSAWIVNTACTFLSSRTGKAVSNDETE